MSSSPVNLYLSSHKSIEGLSFQILEIELTRSDRLINPEDIANLELPFGVDTTGGVMISGRAPIWLYCYLIHELHPTKWIACYDPRFDGGVVVATHSPQVAIAQVIKRADNSTQRQDLCPAIMVVGAPDSGKSVFSHALFRTLVKDTPNIYLQRANWDGEGNWILELDSDADTESIKLKNKGSISTDFFPSQSKAILELRRQKSLVIVDVGGMIQDEKMVVLEACSHYLVVSSQPEDVDRWHEFCGDRGNLDPVAVIHTALVEIQEVMHHYPYLEVISGVWRRGQKTSIPDEVLKKVRSLLKPFT
jgi:CRISPR-associated protein Csx3